MTIHAGILVGIDASPLRVGWAVSAEGMIVAYGTDHIKRNASLEYRRALWIELRETIRAIENQHTVDLKAIGIEAPYVGPNRMGSLNHARQIGQQEAFAFLSFPYAEQHLVSSAWWRSKLGIAPRGKTAPYEYAMTQVVEDRIEQDSADAICIAHALRFALQDSD